ncbi:MAG: DUF2079 domain-containing protein [Thermoanaerobaculales bacterium]|nr:DUF2079 domain-containing protein [Thermoanaerobaculales bacterium]
MGRPAINGKARKGTGTGLEFPKWAIDALAWPVLFGFGTGLALAALQHWDQLVQLVVWNQVSPEVREAFFHFSIIGSIAIPMIVMLVSRPFRRDATTWMKRMARTGRRLKPFVPLTVLPYLLHGELWNQSPIFMQLLLVFVAAISSILLFSEVGSPANIGGDREESSRARKMWVIAAVLATICYVAFVGYYQTLHHYSLGTHAYDMGIMENVFWNSINGDLFGSSIEHEGNHLAVHTSFIYLPLFLAYWCVPRTETLIFLQALAIGGASLPLFFLSRKVTRSSGVAFFLVAVYLCHPATGGANFYDFHELSFLPLFFFMTFLFIDRHRPFLFWFSVVGMLMIKEDMSILVALIGLFCIAESRLTRGMKLLLTGGFAYFVMQHVVIPHFAGGGHSFTWYYTDMIPGDEGPVGLIRTFIANPLFAIRYPVTPPKILFLLQVFGPLAFMPLLRKRGVLLLSYGLVVCLFSSRGPLFELGFQYAFLLVPAAMVGTLLALQDMPQVTKNRFIFAAALLSCVNVYHHGFVYPRHNFKAGFQVVDFDYSQQDRRRREELLHFISLIPADASVTANEELVPHVSTRKRVETLRYAQSGPGRFYDYYFLLINEGTRSQLAREYPEVANLRAYEVVESGKYLSLLRRKSASPTSPPS